MPTLISSKQSPYVKSRFIEEDEKVISDITEVSGWFNFIFFIVTMDVEKAFESLDRSFLISVLKKFGCGNKFITCLKI